MDKYQRFGFVALIFSLFFMVALARGIERVLYISGFVYALVFIFHAQFEKFIIPKIKRPLITYGIFVLCNGLFVEVLAYLSNSAKIRAGESAYLFSTGGLSADLLTSLPYYLILSFVFMWSVKKYELSTFELGAVIALFWGIFVDAITVAPFVWIGSHFIALLHGNIIEFVLAGFLMLFTLHTPIILFENKFKEIYPNRSTGPTKYIASFALQYLSMAGTFIVIFISKNILHIF